MSNYSIEPHLTLYMTNYPIAPHYTGSLFKYIVPHLIQSHPIEGRGSITFTFTSFPKLEHKNVCFMANETARTLCQMIIGGEFLRTP